MPILAFPGMEVEVKVTDELIALLIMHLIGDDIWRGQREEGVQRG